MGLRFESPISFVTRSSSPTTPSASYGIVYASGSDIYYEDDSGVEYKLNRAGTTRVLQYTASTFWIKPEGICEIFVCCLGAGGGGGSGRLGESGTATGGGSGGGGGAMAFRRLRASDLTATSYSIVVGTGGNGGVSQTTNTTNGNPGSNGTLSSFSVSGSASEIVIAQLTQMLDL